MENKLLNKKILLVDDDPIFLKGIMYTVKSLGYTTLTASGGKEAAMLMQKGEVDVVISDLNMPDGNGLQLLNHILKNSSTPVILMTGLSDLKEAQKALDLGARYFISKPFKKAEIAEAIASCLENDKQNISMEEMIKIHLEEFLHGEDLNYPVYMTKNDLLIKVSNGGEALSKETLSSHRDAGFNCLYLKKADYMQYVNFQGQGGVSVAVKTKIFEAGRKCLEELSFVKAFNAEAFERVSIQLISTLEILVENKTTAEILYKMSQTDGFMKRSAYVSVITSLIGHYLGNLKTRDFFNIVVAGLFHELALMGHPLIQNSADLDELNFAERAIIHHHPEVAAMAVCNSGLFSKDVEIMIRQHHEEEAATGYPQGLSSGQMHYLSRIIAVGDAFAFNVEKHHADIQNLPDIIHRFTIQSLGKYNLVVLEALNMVFKISTPEEFVNYQLEELLSVKEVA